MHLRSRRLAAFSSVLALGAGATVVAAPAQAQLLGGLLPNIGTIITGTGQTLGNTLNGILPGVGGVVTGVTGTVGGVVGGVQDSVTGLVDQTLSGVLDGGAGGLLPGGVLDNLLGTLLGNSSGVPGASGNGAPIVLSGGTVATANGIFLDASAPRPTVKVLTKLKSIGSNGKMRLEIKTNEPGIVAVAGSVRPGTRIAKGAKKGVKHSRKVIKIPSIVLGYRKAGKLTVTVKLSRAAQRTLGKSKDARMSVGTVASDLFKNQDSDNVKLNIKR
jgi:hypothetical protein